MQSRYYGSPHRHVFNESNKKIKFLRGNQVGEQVFQKRRNLNSRPSTAHARDIEKIFGALLNGALAKKQTLHLLSLLLFCIVKSLLDSQRFVFYTSIKYDNLRRLICFIFAKVQLVYDFNN